MDTHILARWLLDPRKLTRTQSSDLRLALERGQPLGIAAITLLEISMLATGEKAPIQVNLAELFDELSGSAALRVLPLTYEVALEAGALLSLRDPADRAIVATARLHTACGL